MALPLPEQQFLAAVVGHRAGSAKSLTKAAANPELVAAFEAALAGWCDRVDAALRDSTLEGKDAEDAGAAAWLGACCWLRRLMFTARQQRFWGSQLLPHSFADGWHERHASHSLQALRPSWSTGARGLCGLTPSLSSWPAQSIALLLPCALPRPCRRAGAGAAWSCSWPMRQPRPRTRSSTSARWRAAWSASTQVGAGGA